MSRKADAVGGLPDLGVGYEIMDPNDPEMTTHKFYVRQELPLWGKRGLKRKAAVTEAKAAATSSGGSKGSGMSSHDM
jgi:hypothetical protein